MSNIGTKLDNEGYFVTTCVRSQLESLLGSLGAVIQRERVALRAGAHAYLSKPGSVPLHTDHPHAQLVAWFCEDQDDVDGATHLLDARPVLLGLPHRTRKTLSETHLACPPVEGGAPTQAHPVLTSRGGRDALFCSPWLRAAGGDGGQQRALDELLTALQRQAVSQLIRVRLAPGEVLVVDNTRLLHGRGELQPGSRRTLLRAWIRTT